MQAGPSPSEQTVPDERAPTLGEMLGEVLAGWRVILLTMAVCVALAVLYLRITPPVYSAQLVAATVAEKAATTSAASALLGLNKSGEPASPLSRFNALLRSTVLAERLQQKHNLLSMLFPQGWNKDTQSWTEPDTMTQGILGAVRSFFGRPRWSAPNARSLAEYIGNVVNSSSGTPPGIVTLSARHSNPEFAFNLVQWVYDEIEAILREEHTARLDRQVAFLSNELRQVTNVDHREVLSRLLLEQEKDRMLAKSNAPIALSVLDPASVNLRPVSPPVALTLVGSIPVGLMFGIMVVLVRNAFSGRRRS